MVELAMSNPFYTSSIFFFCFVLSFSQLAFILTIAVPPRKENSKKSTKRAGCHKAIFSSISLTHYLLDVHAKQNEWSAANGQQYQVIVFFHCTYTLLMRYNSCGKKRRFHYHHNITKP
jgi:hypothetical protein